MSILFKGNLEEGNYTLIKSTDGWVLKGETSYVGFNFADRKDEPQKKEVEWVYNKRERLWYPYSNGELLFKDEPTISKMEQVEDETRLTAKCLNCANGSSYKCSKCDGEMYYKYDKDEPQTERSE